LQRERGPRLQRSPRTRTLRTVRMELSSFSPSVRKTLRALAQNKQEDGELPRPSGQLCQGDIRLVDGRKCCGGTSSSTAAMPEQGELQLPAILDEPAGCVSQRSLCPVELPSYSKSATAACSPNRTSGPYACSIPALELSSLCLGSCTPTVALQSSRLPGRQRQWRRNVA